MVLCRLLGGPFDGDKGYLDHEPPMIYAVGCDNPDCELGGVHWLGLRSGFGVGQEPPPPNAVAYRRAKRADDGARLYVFGQGTGGELLAETTRAPEPALA